MQSADEINTAERAGAREGAARIRAGRPLAADAEERNQAILDAATAVFLERGFSRASTAEIAHRAGASKQTLYSRYPTKSALFAALMERRSGKLLASYSDLLQQGMPVDQVLLRYGKKLVNTLLFPETRRLYRLVVAEAVEFPEIALNFWQIGPGQALDQLQSYLHTQVQSRVLRISNVEYAAEQLHGALVGGMSIRNALEIPTLVSTEEEVERWVANTVGAFLRAHGFQV